MSSGPTDPAAPPLWRRALPFVAAAGLVGFSLWRVDLRVFVQRLTQVNAPAYLIFTFVFLMGMLTADTFATVLVYRRTLGNVSFKDFWILRGASYLPSMINHHVGQAFITVYLSRVHGISLARTAGATLLVYVSWSGCILGLGCLSLLATGQSLLWVLLILVAGCSYLGLLAWRPARVAKVSLLAPLFEAGVRGHLLAMAVRVPHLLVLFLGTWLSFDFFGVNIPFTAALTYVPLMMVIVTLPLTPQGFGTRDAFAAAVFLSFAPGNTRADKLAVLAAATTSWGVAITLIEIALALVLLRMMPAASKAEPAASVS